MMQTPLLSIDGLRVEFRTRERTTRAIDGISLDVGAGEFLGLVGESGCGKTVTGLSVLGLLPKTAVITGGSVLFDGEDLLQADAARMRAVRGRRISMIFQDPTSSLNPVFTIGSQLERVVEEHLGLSGAEAREKARASLASVGLSDIDRIRGAYPHQLSGGQKQRCMIAMALSCEPSLLIADEPTTALDVTIQAQILTLLRDLQRRLGISVILITHDLGVVAQVCDRVVVLYAGRVAESGPREAFAHPAHPYTRGLLNAIPRADVDRGTLVAIPGTVPADPGALPGCTFAPRCPLVLDHCREEVPTLELLQQGHAAACFRARELVVE